MLGLTRANELLLSSRAFTSDEALELGMLNAVLSKDELLPHTYDYVRRLMATVSPNALRQTRWQIYRDLHRDVAASVTESESLIQQMMREEDYAEGVAAFVEKRAPQWGPKTEP